MTTNKEWCDRICLDLRSTIFFDLKDNSYYICYLVWNSYRYISNKFSHWYMWYSLITKFISKFKTSLFCIHGYHDEFDSRCLHSNIITWPHQLMKKSSWANFSNKTKTALSSSHPSCFCNALEVNLPVSDHCINKWNHASSFSIVRLFSSSNGHPVISADVL